MTEVRIGLVGCGRLAEVAYVRALRQAGGVDLAAVADPVPERCARAAPGVPAFRSAAELIDAGAADALVLATPAAAHLADARGAAAAGLRTLIEKPPAATLDDTRELARLQPAPFLAFNRRFVPALARLRTVVPTRGPIELGLEIRTRPSSWRSYVADDDVLLNLGPHPIDLARWLSDAEIERVRATLSGSEAMLELELRDGRGGARVRCSEGPYRERVRVTAAGRRIGSHSTGGPLAALRLLVAGSSAEHPLVPSLAHQLEAFGRSVRGEPDASLAGPIDGVAVMAALEAARASAADGGSWVRVDPR